RPRGPRRAAAGHALRRGRRIPGPPRLLPPRPAGPGRPAAARRAARGEPRGLPQRRRGRRRNHVSPVRAGRGPAQGQRGVFRLHRRPVAHRPPFLPRRGTGAARREVDRDPLEARARRALIPFSPAPLPRPRMPHHTELIAILTAGFVLAYVLGLAAHRLRLSPLVGYLVAGIIAGPFTPGFVGDQALAPQLAEIGVILLLFGVGLHFSIRDLMAVKHPAVPGAVVQIAVATLLGWGLARLLGWPGLPGVVFGFSLATASTVVLLRAMEQRRLLDTTRGRIAVGWLIVEDLACMIALVLMPAVATVYGSAGDAPVQAGTLLMAIGRTLVQVALFVAVMLLLGRRVIPWMLERTAGTGSRELFTLAVLSIALGIALGSAELFGVSFALGAFFAGMLLNESELSHKAAQDSLPMRDAFAVLFFVSVGMLFDPMILVREPLLVLAATFIVMFGKSA